jgi:hypothetical protein
MSVSVEPGWTILTVISFGFNLVDRKDTGTVDQNIQSPELGVGLVNGGLYGCCIEIVGPDGDGAPPELFNGFYGFAGLRGGAGIGYGDIGTVFRQFARYRGANAAASTGDEGYFAIKTSHVISYYVIIDTKRHRMLARQRQVFYVLTIT